MNLIFFKIKKVLAKLFGVVSSHQVVWDSYFNLSRYHAGLSEEFITKNLVIFMNKALASRKINVSFFEESRVDEGGYWSKKYGAYTTLPTGRDIYVSFVTKCGKAALLSIQAKRIGFDCTSYQCTLKDEQQAKFLQTHTHIISKIVDRYNITCTSHLFYTCKSFEEFTYRTSLCVLPSAKIIKNHIVHTDKKNLNCKILPKVYRSNSPFLNQLGFFGLSDPLKYLYDYLINNFDAVSINETKQLFDDEKLNLLMNQLTELYRSEKSDDDASFLLLHLENNN